MRAAAGEVREEGGCGVYKGGGAAAWRTGQAPATGLGLPCPPWTRQRRRVLGKERGAGWAGGLARLGSARRARAFFLNVPRKNIRRKINRSPKNIK